MEKTKIAVLIDAENISHEYIEAIICAAQKKGRIVIKNAYGDFSKTNLRHYKDKTAKFAIEMIHRFANTAGKNSSDQSLTIGAMDILYTEEDIDTFCIASSDSDFTGLAIRLRQSNKKVIGMGGGKASEIFVMACDEFIHLDKKSEETAKKEVPDSTVTAVLAEAVAEEVLVEEKPSLKKLKEDITEILTKKEGEGGWMLLTTLSQELRKADPSFSSEKYECETLTQLVEEKMGFEIRKDPSRKRKGPCTVYIRIKR